MNTNIKVETKTVIDQNVKVITINGLPIPRTMNKSNDFYCGYIEGYNFALREPRSDIKSTRGDELTKDRFLALVAEYNIAKKNLEMKKEAFKLYLDDSQARFITASLDTGIVSQDRLFDQILRDNEVLS